MSYLDPKSLEGEGGLNFLFDSSGNSGALLFLMVVMHLYSILSCAPSPSPWWGYWYSGAPPLTGEGGGRAGWLRLDCGAVARGNRLDNSGSGADGRALSWCQRVAEAMT